MRVCLVRALRIIYLVFMNRISNIGNHGLGLVNVVDVAVKAGPFGYLTKFYGAQFWLIPYQYVCGTSVMHKSTQTHGHKRTLTEMEASGS